MEWKQYLILLGTTLLSGFLDYLRVGSIQGTFIARSYRCLLRLLLGFRSERNKDEKIEDLQAVIADLKETIEMFKMAADSRNSAKPSSDSSTGSTKSDSVIPHTRTGSRRKQRTLKDSIEKPSP